MGTTTANLALRKAADGDNGNTYVKTDIGASFDVLDKSIGNVINVRGQGYGATGDGVTDDTTAVQAAFDAVPVGGGTVYLPSGYTFLVSGILVKRDQTRVTGGGTLKGTAKNIRILSTNDFDRVVIEGIRIVGQGKDDGGSSSGRGAISITNLSEHCTVQHNLIETANGSGIVDDGNYNVVEGNQIIETGEHGIYSSSAIGSRYIGNRVVDAGKNSALTAPNTMHGLRLDGSTFCTMIGNVVEDTASAGASLSGYGIVLTGGASQNTVAGNTVARSRTNDIYIGTGTDNVIEGNAVLSNAQNQHSILTVQGGRNVIKGNAIRRDQDGGSGIAWTTSASGQDVCQGNVVYATVAHAAGAPGIFVNIATADDIVITGNVVTSNFARGVEVIAGVERTVIAHNKLLATTPVTDGGTRTTIVDENTGIVLATRDLSNNNAAPSVQVGRNDSAGTEGPAAGTLRLVRADGTVYYLWVDATGDLRIHTAAPTGSSGAPSVGDTAGVVVGTQT